MLVMNDNEAFDDFYMRLTDIITQLHSNGIVYTSKEICSKILRSLAPRFDHKRYIIEEINDPSLTPELLSSKLKTMELELAFRKNLTDMSMNDSLCSSKLAFKTSDAVKEKFKSVSIQSESENESDDEVNELGNIDSEIALMSRQIKGLSKKRNLLAKRSVQCDSQSNQSKKPRNRNANQIGYYCN